jgi:peptide-methionine (S)-S-oxide reductase
MKWIGNVQLMLKKRPAIRWAIFGLCLVPIISTLAQMKNPATTDKQTGQTEVATLGGGCFWCLEAIFKTVDGVVSVTSGYAGGHKPHPTYQEVCTGTTGHAEVVQIRFNPTVISYAGILRIFWDIHDPTTLNRQGNDVGTQYRSIILYQNDTQKKAAEASKAEAARRFPAPLVTQIVPLTAFYPAENYHQDYFALHSNAPYCQMVIRPKLDKFLKHQKAP